MIPCIVSHIKLKKLKVNLYNSSHTSCMVSSIEDKLAISQCRNTSYVVTSNVITNYVT